MVRDPIEHATTLLKNGKLVAIPTETVYGLGADASNPSAVQKIYTVKGRPTTNPLIIHLPNPQAMGEWAIDIPKAAWQLAEIFWPGPLTLILKRHPSVLKLVTADQETVALRVPNHPITLNLLSRFAGGIAAPSANRYGRISPTTAAHVQESLGAEIDYILEGGPCTIGIESTIVSLVDSTPSILRQGIISAQNLSQVLGKSVLNQSEKNNIKVPGTHISHYAPRHSLYLLDKNALLKMAITLTQEQKFFSVLSFSEKPLDLYLLSHQWLQVPLDPKEYGQRLYSNLHQLDKLNTQGILVEAPPDTPEWIAIRDRLQRASHATGL